MKVALAGVLVASQNRKHYAPRVKIVFVLGAGASAGLGYPLGTALKQRILTLLEPANAGHKLMLEAGSSVDEINQFVDDLFHSPQHDTIDSFLAARTRTESVRVIGKRAIVATLAYSESKHRLFRPEPDLEHWYEPFLKFLVNTRHGLTHDDISFITFNYDRSLEHYLFKALTGGHDDLSAFPPRLFVGPANFYHIHGHIGFLPWQTLPSDPDVETRDYNNLPTVKMVRDRARNILVPHEDFQVPPEWSVKLRTADYIIFLGFGFHKPNLKRIWWDELVQKPQGKILATTLGLEAERLEILKKENVRVFPVDCRGFINAFIQSFNAGTLEDFGVTFKELQLREKLKTAALAERLTAS